MHVPWTEIDSFHSVRRSLLKYPELLQPVAGTRHVTYKSKVKLHGTNAGVRVTSSGQVVALSRSSVVTTTSDNAGFAKWVEERADQFVKLAVRGDIVIYGEWCGPGIQKNVAVNKIPTKTFAIFAVRFEGILKDWEGLEVEPDSLKLFCVDGAHVLPWFNGGEETFVDWDEPAEVLQLTTDKVNEAVAEVERCDPWVKDVFGVEGTGEGLVFYPVSHPGYKSFSNLCFKAKGEKHQVVAHTKAAQVDPTVAANIAAFAEMVTTEARLEQGVRAVSNGELVFEPKNIPAFLKWINADVTKETKAELDASGLEEKEALRACVDKARKWYLQHSHNERISVSAPGISSDRHVTYLTSEKK